MADTLIVLTTILPTTNSVGSRNRIIVNEQYRNMINTLRGSGRPSKPSHPPYAILCLIYVLISTFIVVVGEMQDLIMLDDLADGIHPHDEGYKKMAWAIWVAIENANLDGLIKDAAPFEGTIPSTTCDKVFGSGTYAGGLTQRGSGIGDGIYYHDSQAMGVILTIYSDWDRDQW